jgi:exodeoxyribonuclease VII small subunit
MASKNDSSDSANRSGRDEGFEAVYKRLEETVSKLEQGNLTLEESIALYEEGMKLAKRCQEQLQKAEQRITRLQETFSGGTGAVREETPEYEPLPEPDEAPIE